jgi:hypothetical protein
VVVGNNGGDLFKFVDYWRRVAVAPDRVEIRGPCVSACAMVLAYVPKDRLCIGWYSYFAFHMVRRSDNGVVIAKSTQWMMDQFPAEIRDWMEAQGGFNSMPVGEKLWIMTPQDLWKMGYSKCVNWIDSNGFQR